MEDMTLIFDKFKAETSIPSIVLTTEYADNMAVTDSKLGGNPYLPKDFKYPATSKGECLKLLAQLNFAKLPKLENFPPSGILQFYVLPSDDMGLYDFRDSIKQDTFRVIYHEKILPDEMLMKDFPEIIVNGRLHTPWFPVEGELLLKGTVKNCHMTHHTYEFKKTFTNFCKNNNIEPFFESYLINFDEAKKNMTKAQYDKHWKKRRELYDLINEALYMPDEAEVHRISGYPNFIQGDPRFHYDYLKKYDTLLLQIESEMHDEKKYGYKVIWGDGGVANFFINLEDLKNLNFQDVFYTWDCC